MSEKSISTIRGLLSQVSTLTKKHDEIAKITGEKFNIFKILGVSTSEVRLHSTLLAELLNPKGSHGLKDSFLKLFIEKLHLSDENHLAWHNTESATVEVEKWTGNIDEERNVGGYIDIYIGFQNGSSIIIENKIYAGDQEGQLRRYRNSYKDAILIYLTLDGKKASHYTTKNDIFSDDKITPMSISYKDFITAWLELCKKEAVDYPVTRETITQYIYLINYLTNQTMNDKMKEKLVQMILKNQEYIKSAEEIARVWEACQFEIIENLKVDIENIAKKLDLEYKIDEINRLGEVYSGFWFYRKDWPYCIYFYFEPRFCLYVKIDNVSNEIKYPDEIAKKLKEHLENFSVGSKKYQDRIWSSDFKQWDETSWADVSKKIPKGIEDVTKQILEKLEGFKP